MTYTCVHLLTFTVVVMSPQAAAIRLSALLTWFGVIALMLMAWWYPYADRTSTIGSQLAIIAIAAGVFGVVLAGRTAYARYLQSFLHPGWIGLAGFLALVAALNAAFLTEALLNV